MPNSEPKNDPVSPFAHQVLAVYAQALPDVRFPDLDLTLLQAQAEELRSLQLEAERIEALLEAARRHTRAQSDLLNASAEKAMAYARVFADGDTALSERLAEVSRSGRAKSLSLDEGAQPKKRGRPKKSDPDSSLFGLGDMPSIEAAQ